MATAELFLLIVRGAYGELLAKASANGSTVAGASQVYYSTLTSPGNAIQANQAALQ